MSDERLTFYAAHASASVGLAKENISCGSVTVTVDEKKIELRRHKGNEQFAQKSN